MSKGKILVCGGREYQDWETFRDTLDQIVVMKGWITEPDEYDNYLPHVTIITGMARGADTLALDWAVLNWCPYEEYPPNWALHGKAAGPIRNQQMLDEGKPDIVVAFPGGVGTADMIKRARKQGVEVVVIS